MSYLILAIFPAALIAAAFNDIAEFKIPNWIPVVLLAAFPVAIVSSDVGLSYLWQGLMIGAGMLVVGFGLFALKVAGGGDGKLLAAVAPWIGLSQMFNFLLATAFFGGVLAIAILFFRQLPILPIYARHSWLMEMHQNNNGIPYGVAIAIGALVTFPHTVLFTTAFGT